MSCRSRYAHLERERRFLLGSAPTGPELAVSGMRTLEIEDRYLRATRLRVRSVREAGHPPVRKLGQKVRSDLDHPSTVEHTTLYLDDAETAALSVLPGDVLAKTRTLHPWQGLTVAVDVFAGPLSGLVLAEVDLADAGVLPASGLPLPWLAEVTDDERFTGGHLARTSSGELAALLGDTVSGPHAVEDVPRQPRRGRRT